MAAAGLIAMAWNGAAQATHPGLPRLDLGALDARPGGTLVVRGMDMGADQPVTLVLAGPAIELSLGTAIADGHGSFNRPIQIPAQTTPGDYAVRALVGGRQAARARLAVSGSPLPTSAEAEQPTRGAEPLRRPLPRSR